MDEDGKDDNAGKDIEIGALTNPTLSGHTNSR